MPFTIDMNRFREVTGTQDPAAAPAFDKPMTYEDRLLGDLPARIAKAQELIGSGLDYQGGLKELDFVDNWAKDPKNAQALTTILMDKANDPQTLALKQSAMKVYARQGFDLLRARAEVNSGPKTFAISILQDIPAARRKAEALLASGDIENGKIALEEARSLVNKNSGMTEMLFNYTGDNPMLKKAQEVMLGSSDWESKIAPLTDGSTNKAAPDFYIRQNNLGANQGFFFKNAVQGDPESKRVASSVMSVFGQAPATPRRGSADPEQADAAPAALPDIEGGFSYAKKAMDIGGGVVDFGDMHVVSKAKQLFEAGDGDNNGAGMNYAVDAVKKSRELRGSADPALDKDTFTRSADVYAKAIGGATTAERKREAGATFLELTANMKPGEMQTTGSQAAQAVSGAYNSLKAFADLGYDAERSAKPLAGVLFKKARGLELSPEEAAVDTTFATARKYKAGIKERLRTQQEVDSKGQPVDSGLYVGFDRFNSGFAQAIDAVTGEALSRGEKLDEATLRQKFSDPNGVGIRKLTGLVRSLDPLADEAAATGAATLMADMFATTGEIDAAKIGTYVKAAAQARGRTTAAIANAPAGAVPAATQAQAKKESVEAAKRTIAETTDKNSPDSRFLGKALGMDLRDSAWYSLSSWDLAAGGRGANVLRETLRDSWKTPPPAEEAPAGAVTSPIKEVFSGNPDVVNYVKTVSAADLADEGKRAAVNKKISDQVMQTLLGKSGVVKAATTDAATMARVRNVADMFANTYTTNLRDELRGARSGVIGERLTDAVVRSVSPDAISSSPETMGERAADGLTLAGVAAVNPIVGVAAAAQGAIGKAAVNAVAPGVSRFFGQEATSFAAPIEDRLADALIPPGAETEAARNLLAKVGQGVLTGFAEATALTEKEQAATIAATSGKSMAEIDAISAALKRVSDRVQKPLTDVKTLELGKRVMMAASDKLSGIPPEKAQSYVDNFFAESEDLKDAGLAFDRSLTKIGESKTAYVAALKKAQKEQLRETLELREEVKGESGQNL